VDMVTRNSRFDDQLFELTLNRPKGNILDTAMMVALQRGLDWVASQPRAKLVVIRGADKHFCFGASVAEHAPGAVDGMLPGFHRLIEHVLAFPVPSLAAVSGQCLGGGFELALACSMMMADQSAAFAVPEIQLGVFPPVAAALLPPALAARMVLTGASHKVETLQAAGLLTEVCAIGELEAALEHFFETQLSPMSASSLRIAQRAAGMAKLSGFRQLIPELERLYLGELMATADAKEGISAFLDKRQPQWQNQ